MAPFQALLGQTSEHQVLSMHAVNFPQLFTVSETDGTNASIEYKMVSTFLIVVTICVLGIVLLFLSKKKYDVKANFVQLLTWCIWTCDFFLPAMHERYDFMIGILLIVLTCLNVRYLPLFLGVAIIDMIIYINSFFNIISSFQPYAWLMLILYGTMTFIIVKQPKMSKTK